MRRAAPPSVRRAAPATSGAGQRPVARAVLADREGRRARRAAAWTPAANRAIVRPKIGLGLGRGQEVARAARSRVGAPVVAARRVVQRDLHEPGERHRAGRARSRPGSPRAAPGPTGRPGGGRDASQVHGRCPPPSASRRPGPDERVAAEDDRDRRRRGAEPSAPGATGRRSGPAGGGRSRSDPRRPASRARRRRTGGRAGPGCRRGPRRRARRGRVAERLGPVAIEEQTEASSGRAAGRRRGSGSRAPRSGPASATRSIAPARRDRRPTSDRRRRAPRRGSRLTARRPRARPTTAVVDAVAGEERVRPGPVDEQRVERASRDRPGAASAGAGRATADPAFSASQRGRPLSAARSGRSREASRAPAIATMSAE